jgi:hypothetical protein
MTHDELLAKIEYLEQYEFGRYEKTFRIFKNSLRAVVELHKPEHSIRGYRCTFDDETYPCLTIEVVEKVLTNG